MANFRLYVWRHHRLQADDFDTLADAVSYARYGEDEGRHVYSHIEECVGGVWSVVPAERVEAAGR